MRVRMVLKCELGEYISEDMEVSEDQYKGLKEMSKTFYSNGGGFEMYLDNGFLIVSPEIVKKSILLIETLS
jgi:hypothetical protein